MFHRSLLLTIPLLAGCGGDDTRKPAGQAQELPELEPPPEGQGFQVSMSAVAPPLSEAWVCAVYDLPTTELSPVNWVEYLQNPGTHHMTLSTTFLSGVELESGVYDCADIYEDPAVMGGLLAFFGNQGEGQGRLQLPEGVAAMLPGGIQILHEVHYVNATEEEVSLYSIVNAWTIPADEVQDTIWGGQVRDENITVPAGQQHSEWTRCLMNEDVEVHFLASHTHATATSFTIAPYDGSSVGEVMYTNEDWHNPMIVQYPEPLVVPAGQGFEFTCTYNNTTDQDITYGYSAEDEMCNMAIVFTPGNPSALCEVVETSDGVLWSP
jgi:Copper type II ascorbate-dependent monooxygenase, C-terminal domain